MSKIKIGMGYVVFCLQFKGVLVTKGVSEPRGPFLYILGLKSRKIYY